MATSWFGTMACHDRLGSDTPQSPVVSAPLSSHDGDGPCLANAVLLLAFGLLMGVLVRAARRHAYWKPTSSKRRLRSAIADWPPWV